MVALTPSVLANSISTCQKQPAANVAVSVAMPFSPLACSFVTGLARRPEASLLAALLLVGGPELLAHLGLLHRDRLGAVGEHVHRLAHADVLADKRVAALVPQPLQQLLRRRPLMLGRVLERRNH